MSGSSTSVIELPSRAAAHPSVANATGVLGRSQEPQATGESRLGAAEEASRRSPGVGSFTASDGAVVEAAEKWNSPRINIFRLGATFWSLMIMGANDSAYGVSCSLPADGATAGWQCG